jgi:hypothetical protein
MYAMKTFDCKIDGVWGSSIHTQFAEQDIPREITVKHELGTTVDAMVVATRRSNRVVLYCCGGKIHVKVMWESSGAWKDTTGERGMEEEYTAVREIRTIWGDRTLKNRASIERFIRRTILNIRKFVRQTQVWGDEVGDMWAEATNALDVIVETEMAPKRPVAPTIPSMVFTSRV